MESLAGASCARRVRALEEEAVRDRVEGVATLRVDVEFSDTLRRSLGVGWSFASAAPTELACARIFLVPLGGDPRRIYLDIVDRRSAMSVRLPEGLADGEYAIEVDAYGSASWGDGRLDARGRSASFTIGPPTPSESALSGRG
ncbi:hypothetical protein OG874_15270 [Nocardia sp. NBC_00565]|uniref:hypothetical protein n=1 Tax=Nocardia sp. NBC_00565 TaxID=2975993 RepID=UPI002E81048D|nr:hypothetical protein [Nocardia sp. NBC_00565]WUC06409.1 hypothetical protein OG874_15270 [Nocardia sp. NBC_00565]